MTIYLVVTGQPEHSLREIRKYIKCIKYLCTVCNLYKKCGAHVLLGQSTEDRLEPLFTHN